MTAPIQMATGDWVDEALCAQTDPEVFHPEKGGSNAAAKAVCAWCPVQRPCLRWAVETSQSSGILGGLSPRERRLLTVVAVDALPPVVVVDLEIPEGRPVPVVPKMRPRPIPNPRPVPEVAENDVVQEVVALVVKAPVVPVKKTRVRVAECGTPSGYARHRRAGETACEPCKQAIRDRDKARGPHRAKEVKEAVRVLWLLPALVGPGHLEYAVDDGQRWAPVGADTAAVLMRQGEPVHVRTVTDWAPVTRGAG